MRRSLRARLTLWYTTGLGALLLLLGGAALGLLDRGMRANVDASLASVAEVIVESRRDPARAEAEALRRFLGPAFEHLYRFLDPRGEPPPEGGLRPGPSFPLSETARRRAARGLETYETIRSPAGAAGEGSIRLLTKPVVEQGRMVNLVQVGMPLDAVESARSELLVVLLGFAPLALAGVALGGWLLAGRALAPVGAMADTARRIGAEDLARRLPVEPGRDEIARLAVVVNDMLARLERSFTAARSFSADAAHELRTPLTILKGELQVALRGDVDERARETLESCLEEVERMAVLVEDLLFLARADAGAVDLAAETIDLADVVEEARPAIATLAERAGVTLDVRGTRGTSVRGSPAMLFRVVLNLAENAVKHSGAGHRVEIDVRRASPEGASLEVRDDGPGVPAEDRERIFERFHRVGASRGEGSGLGLPIVRSIVALHGGEITLHPREPAGSVFRVVLPLAESPR